MVLALLIAVGQEAACLDGRNKLSHFGRSQYIGIICGSGKADPVIWVHDTMLKRQTQYLYAVRKFKKSINFIRTKKLFESALMGDTDLLKEIKQRDLPDTVA